MEHVADDSHSTQGCGSLIVSVLSDQLCITFQLHPFSLDTLHDKMTNKDDQNPPVDYIENGTNPGISDNKTADAALALFNDPKEINAFVDPPKRSASFERST